jgi:single-strand DNA-binding protein
MDHNSSAVKGKAVQMNDTLVTLVGNAATGVDYRETGEGVPVGRFRLAVTARRWDRQRGSWTDGHTSFYTVWTWRTLAVNTSASVSVGEPLIVQGKLRVREEERAGQRRVSVEVDALAVGHDLSRGTSAFRRVSPAKPGLTAPALNAATPAGHGPAPRRSGPEASTFEAPAFDAAVPLAPAYGAAEPADPVASGPAPAGRTASGATPVMSVSAPSAPALARVEPVLSSASVAVGHPGHPLRGDLLPNRLIGACCGNIPGIARAPREDLSITPGLMRSFW